jgi:cell division protein FtsZ
VSVVATGIDKSAADIASNAQPIRSSDRPAPQIKPLHRDLGAPRAAAPAPVAAPVAAPKPVAEMPIQLTEADIERELRIEPEMLAPSQPADDFVPQSRLFAGAQPVEQQPRPIAGYHVPPSQPAQRQAPVYAEPVAPQPVARETLEQARMPRVEDFPPVVQAEMEHRQAPSASDERGPMGLLKRISNSLGRREEEEPAPRAQAERPAPQRALSPEASLYAPRRGQLDEQGRAVPAARRSDDDQLEIPAFLRRQAN